MSLVCHQIDNKVIVLNIIIIIIIIIIICVIRYDILHCAKGC